MHSFRVTYTGMLLVASAAVLSLVMLSSDAARVTIENRLGYGRTIDIHCASGDDDLNEHTIDDYDDYYWEFNPNIWGTTLFYCDINWGGYYAHFDAYVYYRDRSRCNYYVYCWWMIDDYALYSWNQASMVWEVAHFWLA